MSDIKKYDLEELTDLIDKIPFDCIEIIFSYIYLCERSNGKYYYFKNDNYKTIRKLKIYPKVNICKGCFKEYYYINTNIILNTDYPDKCNYYDNKDICADCCLMDVE